MKLIVTQTDTLARVTLSVAGLALLPIATASVMGGVKIGAGLAVDAYGTLSLPLPGTGGRTTLVAASGVLTVPDACFEAVLATNTAISSIVTAAMVAASSTTVPAGRSLRIWLQAGGSIAGDNIDGAADIPVGPRAVNLQEFNGRWVVL